MARCLVSFAFTALLMGCAHQGSRGITGLGSWDSCVMERMCMRTYERQHEHVRQMAEAFHAILQRVKREPEFLDRAIPYWGQLAEAYRQTPSEFNFEAEWADFKACSELPGAEVFSYSAKRGDYFEEGMVVVKGGKVLRKHKVFSGTERTSD